MRGSPFFDGVSRVDIEIAGRPAKVPVFYYDTSAITALFPARYRELRKLMPDPELVPARLAPGVGAIAIACLEHRDTDIGPYDELAISVPLNVPPFRANLPGRALWEGARRGRHDTCVLHLPVTTEVALRGGIDFYNFPKFQGRIEFDEHDGLRRCSLHEGEEHILTLRAEKLTAVAEETHSKYVFHLWMDGQPQQAEFKIHGLARAGSLRPGAATIEPAGRHPIAQELERLLLSRRSLACEYVPKLEAILYGPEHLTLPLLTRALEATAAGSEVSAPTGSASW